MIHDTTERKQTEVQLHKLSRAVEQSPVSIVITDAKGSIEYVNPKFTELTGYSLEETIGQNPRILKTEQTSQEEYKKMWDIILSGQIWHGEFCNHKKNGEVYWETASISPILNEKGDITHFVAIKEDVTEHKRTQALITEALEFNQTILQTSPIGIIIYKASGECIAVNTAAANIINTDPDNLIKQNFHQIESWRNPECMLRQ